MLKENIAVHGLWIGKYLSVVELLCVNSFIANGHEFHLWVYETPEASLPSALILEDANSIVSSEMVFSYRNKNQFGHGKGSFAGFSDIFRYQLLYKFGGWWTDMDVICLKPLDFSQPYVFRTHHDFAVVGNIMKCPSGSELMKNCFQKATTTVNAENSDWNLPIKILNDEIVAQKLQDYIVEFTNRDSWMYVRKLLLRNVKIPESWKALHLVNEEWRRNRIDKTAIPRFSYLGKIIRSYNLETDSGFLKVFRNYFRITFPRNAIVQAYWLFARIFWKTVRVFKKERKNK
jgi:hypothetical protein